MKSFQVYPTDLQSLEAAAIKERRGIVDGPARDPRGPQFTGDATASGPPGPVDGAPPPLALLPKDTIGLALSGGGIRSSTFCLGFLQAMASRGLLRHVDILSTVSGGGYVGSFLGRFYDRLRTSPATAPDVVERSVANAASAQVRWLRDNGQYMAPAGKGDLAIDFAIFLRNFLTVQFVLGLLGLALYGLVNAFRYGFADRVNTFLPFVAGFGWDDLPIGHLVHSARLGIFWSPWFVLTELVLLFTAIPNALGYWLASQDEPETYNRPALLLTFLLFVALLAAGVRNGLQVTSLIAALAIVLALPFVEIVWRRVRAENAAVGTGGPRVQQLRARTHLSHDLAMWLGVGGLLAFFALIDTAGHAVYEAYGRHNKSFAVALSQLGAGLLALLPILRGAAQLIGERRSGRPGAGSVTSLLSRPAVSGALAVLLMAPPLVILSYVSHAAFGGGGSFGRGVGISGFALLLSLVVALPWAITLVNRSSLQSTYAARIARAFLGASNPNRGGVADDEVHPGDDVDVLTAYRPFKAGGPLHLINVCVNQTVDRDTLRGGRSRGGVAMACSSLSVSVDKYAHAKWNPAYEPSPITSRVHPTPGARQTPPLEALSHVPGTPHPLVGADGLPPDDVELLPLRDWIAISGAAVGPGMGKSTNAALSILFLLANVRVGYWWDSGLTAGVRGSRPAVSFVRRVLWLMPQLFATQALFLYEGTAAFRGPWNRFWYLSDGGHFENLGGYELVRRRVPVMILVDGDADPDYAFSDFANFQRKVRIDFQAEIEPFGDAEWKQACAAKTSDALKVVWNALGDQLAVAPGQGGPLDELLDHAPQGRRGTMVKRHAALYRVRYPGTDSPDSVLLYVKASMSGDEPTDVEQYRVEHPDFPHEPTANQFFDEPQWESYRRLGEHVGDSLLGPKPARDVPPPDRSGLWMTGL